MNAIPQRWTNQDPTETARRFLDAPDAKHPMWEFLDVPIEADFNLSPETIAPFVVRLLDLINEIESTGTTAKFITIKAGQLKVI